ncbi:DUF5685 family protein [Crossiella sp. CA-258035]|uniref:DUF5685 family protein n=1 Tax=Crossiella sp. CA-258035 TaxID=2981138 RepID=UPI0024BD37B4|nr:DUF5685 family protein [Crossiella sp. CA-258035]WHT17378.1 DUF5685 family protein [Crossiella sp. CA-258035]
MFGIIRPCRHRLDESLRAAWWAHLCGLCLALRDDHGQVARTATNYDGLVISALVEAQQNGARARRKAGPCPLRGMRGAEIANGDGARLAAVVSLILASAKISDHVADADGVFAARPVAGVARKLTARWAERAGRTGTVLGFDTAVLLDAVHRQPEVEAAAGLGSSVLAVTEPTETATGAAFAHTAVLAGRPHNAAPLGEAGRLFGRIVHLLDAVEDLEADRAAGAWNPLLATGVDLAEARRLCDDAVLGVRLALKEAELTDQRLVHALLAHELDQAVRRTFAQADPHAPERDTPHKHEAPETKGKQRGLVLGCGVAALSLFTCQTCCATEYHDPWTGERKEGWCHRDNCCTNCCGECCNPCGCCEGCCSNCSCDC